MASRKPLVLNAGNIEQLQAADILSTGYVDRGNPSDYDLNFASFTMDGTWRDLDLSSYTPTGAYAIHIQMWFSATVAGGILRFKEKGNSNDFNALRQWTQRAGNIQLDGIVACDSNREVQYKGDSAINAGQFAVRGWFI